MGVVYRARDTRLGRTVALKVLRPGSDPELLHRLDREARAASALNHPNIVQIYDVGVAAGEAGEHYVVMEYVEGETLRRRLARGPLPVQEVLDLGAQLADGLARAHRAGILHRDLKPENLVVTPEGLLKILDFGLAKVVAAPLGDVDARETLTRHGTQAGMLVGTLEYMSPEQASGRPVDARTDQFAVGTILGEMATGRPLFGRPTPAQVLAAVIERDPEPLRRLRPEVPEALETLVARCLQKDPARRYVTTDELASELAALAGRSRARSLGGVPIVPSAPPSVVSAEIVPAPSASPQPAVYHVQTALDLSGGGTGKVRRYDERQLVDLIRDGKLTGVELVRRDDEERWQPLYESHVFRREVPSVGDPREAARWRVLRQVGGHFSSFFLVAGDHVRDPGALPLLAGDLGRGPGRACPEGRAHGDHPAAKTGARRRAAPGPARRRPPAATPAAGGGCRGVADRAGGRAGARAPRAAGGKRRPSPAGRGGRHRRSGPPSSRRARRTSRSRPPTPSAPRSPRPRLGGPRLARAGEPGPGPPPLRAPARRPAEARGGDRQGDARPAAPARPSRDGRAPAEAAPPRSLPRRRRPPSTSRSCPRACSTSATRSTPGRRSTRSTPPRTSDGRRAGGRPR